MKNKLNVLSVRLLGIIALVAVIILSETSCFGKSFNNADELKEYLDSQPKPANSPDKPIKITIKVNDSTFQSFADVIGPAGKYVSIKLSGNALTKIGSFHEGSKMIVSIIIPKNVTSIDGIYPLFNDYTNLKAINVNSSNKIYSSDQGVLFFKPKDKTKLFLGRYPKAKAGAYTIPNSVTGIVEMAFNDCKSLTSVTIPNSVTNIGGNVGGAFLGCTSLTSVTIPNSVTSIRDRTFSDCTSLTSVTIPDSVTSIGNYAFSGCTSLTSVTIPNSITSIGERTFDSCTSLTSVTIPNSITSIGRYAFNGCTSLARIIFQGKITPDNFSHYDAFNGDLSDKYLSRSYGGIGTYTTTAPVNKNSIWTKK